MNSIENRECKNTDQTGLWWYIDLDWYQQNNRSFSAVTISRLCPKCRKRLTGEVSAVDLITSIKDCCSKNPGFITGELPVLESVFRLFLANGNQPLSLDELGKQLSEWRGGGDFCASGEILSRLLASDQYYGLRQNTR